MSSGVVTRYSVQQRSMAQKATAAVTSGAASTVGAATPAAHDIDADSVTKSRRVCWLPDAGPRG